MTGPTPEHTVSNQSFDTQMSVEGAGGSHQRTLVDVSKQMETDPLKNLSGLAEGLEPGPVDPEKEDLHDYEEVCCYACTEGSPADTSMQHAMPWSFSIEYVLVTSRLTPSFAREIFHPCILPGVGTSPHLAALASGLVHCLASQSA